MKSGNILLTIALAGAIGGAAFAHGGATGIVKERMDGMSSMAEAIKSLTAIMQGEVPYDPAQVQSEAQALQKHSGETLANLFPDGTGKAPSEAKPEIWSNWSEFEGIANQLELYAKALELAAPNGLMMEQSDSSTMMGTDQSEMMGGENSGMMMGNSTPMDLTTLAEMPADGIFIMLAQTCASCHSKFRYEKK